MALFPCSKCGCVEDTALCHFWSARLRQMPTVCSACDPTIGKWHGEFPREPQLRQDEASRSCVPLSLPAEGYRGARLESFIRRTASSAICDDISAMCRVL